MAELPSFLKRCDRYPRSIKDREDDWCTPSRCCHQTWGRAYELSVSFETLLKTKDVADLFVNFLMASHLCDTYENCKERKDFHYKHGNKILWMSNTVFITRYNIQRLIDLLNKRLWDHGKAAKAYSITIHDYSEEGVWIVQLPSIAAEGAPDELDSLSPPFANGEMDVLLRLLSKVKTVSSTLSIQANKTNEKDGDDNTTEFPASLGALKDFVRETWIPRTICLQAAGLSQAQWNTVTTNCNTHVTIKIDYKKDNDKNSFLEATILHHCPAQIEFDHFEWAPKAKQQLLLTAIESATALVGLHMWLGCWNKETFLSWMNVILRNRSLKWFTLSLSNENYPEDDLTMEEWELVFCRAIASHPTLQEVQIASEAWSGSLFEPSPARDDILIPMLSQNTVLWKFEGNSLVANSKKFKRVVDPVLKFNHIRHWARRIKQETHTARRQRLFTATLLSNQVCQNPAYRYLLLKENFDLLKQSPSIIEDMLFSEWNMTKRHLLSFERRMRSVEERMRDRGLVIPTNLTMDGEIINDDDFDGRKPKRSHSSS